jgi:hypothetical protein
MLKNSTSPSSFFKTQFSLENKTKLIISTAVRLAIIWSTKVKIQRLCGESQKRLNQTLLLELPDEIHSSIQNGKSFFCRNCRV